MRMTFMQRNECHYFAQKSRPEEAKTIGLLGDQTTYLVYKKRNLSFVPCVKFGDYKLGCWFSSHPTFRLCFYHSLLGDNFNHLLVRRSGIKVLRCHSLVVSSWETYPTEISSCTKGRWRICFKKIVIIIRLALIIFISCCFIYNWIFVLISSMYLFFAN